MKWTNGELVDIYNNAFDYIQLAINELEGVEEYREEFDTLNQAKDSLVETVEPYMQSYNRECEEELECQNREHERSVS